MQVCRKHDAGMTAGPHKDHGYVFQTWNLLHSPGIEVAAFPLLYPQSSFGDTNLKDRLVEKNWIGSNAKPFIGFTTFLHAVPVAGRLTGWGAESWVNHLA